MCKHTFYLLVLVSHMIQFHMDQQHPVFKSLMTDLCEVVLFYIPHMQSNNKYTAMAVSWSVFIPQGVDSRKPMLSSVKQTNWLFTHQGGR